jgi:anthranilate phosphoribosyltransferase
VRYFEIDPAEFGFHPTGVDVLAGGEPAENARRMREVLGGATGPAHDVIVINAGAAIWTSGAAATLADGIGMAAESIRTGAAVDRLLAFCAATQRLGPRTAH